jgi:peroxiredoxin Q/BCP
MVSAGERAPAFKLQSDGGSEVSLSDFKGQTLVLYFYPRNDTPGCTREAIGFSKIAGDLKKAGAAVVGVSKDSVASHCKFRDKYSLKIPLLSDPDLTVHNAYGAYGEKMMYGKKVQGVIRSTFVIDGSGKVIKAFPAVKVDGHPEKVLELVKGGGSEDDAPVSRAKPAKKVAKAKPAARPSPKVKKAPAKAPAPAKKKKR